MQNKIGYIICAHSVFSEGLVKALEMIAGSYENIKYINFLNGDDPEELKNKIKKIANEYINKGQEVCYLVDLYGATPFNCSLEVGFELGGYLISGVNLPMLLDLALSQPSEDENILRYLENSVANIKEHINIVDISNIVLE